MQKKLARIGNKNKGILTYTFVSNSTPVFSIARLVTLLQVDYNDITYSTPVPFIFSGLEPTLAVTLPCIPLLRPLLGQSKYSANGTARFGPTMPTTLFSRVKWGRKHGGPVEIPEDVEVEEPRGREIQLTPLPTEHTTKIWRSRSQSLGGGETDGEDEHGSTIHINKAWNVEVESQSHNRNRSE